MIYIFIVILLILGCKKQTGDYFDREQTLEIRGISSFFIVLTHIPRMLEDRGGILQGLSYIGYLCVAVFFLYSGYNIAYSYCNKKEYLQGFVSKKILKLYIPFVVTNLFYIIFEIINGGEISVKGFIFLLLGGSLVNPTAWYVVAIFIFYIVFYVSFKYLHSKNIVLWSVYTYIFWIIFCGFGEKVGLWNIGEGWYISTLPFVLGVFWMKYKDKINAVLGQYYFIVLFIITSIFASTFIGNIKYNNIVYAIISATVYPILCNLILMKIRIGNKVWKFFGEISLELYLIHSLILNIFKSNLLQISNVYLYCCITIVISVIVAKILHDIMNKLKKRKVSV